MRSQVEHYKHAAHLFQQGDLTLKEFNLLSVISCRTLGGLPCTIREAQPLIGGRNTTYRALKALEQHKLVHRIRKHGRAFFYATVAVQAPLREESPRKQQPRQQHSTPNKAPKSHGERKKRVAPAVPKEWGAALSEKQQAHLHTYSVQPHLKTPVEKALAATHPSQINSATLNSIRNAIDPLAYVSKLVNSDGKFQPHCYAAKQPPETPKSQPQKAKRAQPPEEQRRVLSPEEQAKCDKKVSDLFAQAQKMLEETPEDTKTRRRTSKPRKTF